MGVAHLDSSPEVLAARPQPPHRYIHCCDDNVCMWVVGRGVGDAPIPLPHTHSHHAPCQQRRTLSRERTHTDGCHPPRGTRVTCALPTIPQCMMSDGHHHVRWVWSWKPSVPTPGDVVAHLVPAYRPNPRVHTRTTLPITHAQATAAQCTPTSCAWLGLHGISGSGG